MKIITANVNGLNNNIKRRRILTNLTKMNPTIVLLQETHIKKTVNEVFHSKKFQQQYLAAGTSKARGVAILISSNIRFTLGATKKDPARRYLFVKGTLEDKQVTIATLYAPNSGQLDFLAQTLALLTSFAQGDIIVGGDFNMILDSHLDRSYHLPSAHKPFKRYTDLKDIIEKHNLEDVWRLQHAGEKDFTFYSAPHNVYSRIDYILLSSALIDKVTTTTIDPSKWSDHAWPVCTMSHLDTSKKIKQWMLNTSLLENQLIREETEAEIKQYLDINLKTDTDLDINLKKHLSFNY